MSEKCQQATSLDHFIGASEQRRWYSEPERFRGLEVQDELELSGLCEDMTELLIAPI